MPKKTLTLYMAKPDVDAFDGVLSENGKSRLQQPTTQTVDAPEFADGARLFVFVSPQHPIGWVKELRHHFAVDANITASSACAVLVFKVADRHFVATFAHGWMLLDEDNIEGDFGLRVALNTLNDKKLKRLERANLGDALRGISQSPFQRDFTSFGMDDALDLVRKISGTAREDAEADALTGAKSLKLTGEFSVPDLPELAAEALVAFASRAYQDTSFKVIDFVTPVLDQRRIKELDDAACESIKADRGEFELGLPATGEQECVGYKFVGARLRGIYPDLLMANYIAALGDQLDNIEPKTLRDDKIASIGDDPTKAQKWSIRTALVGSIVYEEGRYAINEGEWYRIDEAFKLSIEERFRDLHTVWRERPIPLRKIYDTQGNGTYESEASYNAALARELGLCLLDTKLVDIPGIERSQFEVCDLLDIVGKRFIHVKKNSRRSSVLSHFFKQGSNAAQQLSKFPAVWSELERVVKRECGAAAVEELRVAREDEARPWTVEFLIADTPRQNGEFNIPFFSKISLRDEAVSLAAMGYQVVLKFIGLEEIQTRRR